MSAVMFGFVSAQSSKCYRSLRVTAIREGVIFRPFVNGRVDVHQMILKEEIK